jgi:hypothetical protein
MALRAAGGRRKGAPDLESATAVAARLDDSAGGGDDVLHDREAETGAS